MAEPRDLDLQVRLAAGDFLASRRSVRAEALPHRLLVEGFKFQGVRVPLIGPQGIFKPAILPDMPLSIMTVHVPEGGRAPYEDGIGDDGLIRYRYRGTDPGHRDNVGLRLAMHRRVPLIYFVGVDRGWYAPVFPVYVVGDDPPALSFTIAADEEAGSRTVPGSRADLLADARRCYVTRVTRERLHQSVFRGRVLRAYRERCAICHLGHRELLDAAHILPDGHPLGEPIVPNGLALCKLHHAAFDANIVGVRPDLLVEVRQDVLREPDGPMLEHGLRGFHRQVILVPSRPEQKPNRDYLEERYAIFREAG